MSKIFKMGELFCGPGGLALGAIKASKSFQDWGVQPIWANDIDKDTCNTYALNIHGGKDSAVYCSPVEKLDVTKLPNVDGLCFGFPCNDFSLVGEQKGTKGKFGKLYSYCINAVQAKNPKWFIAENVSGLRSANDGVAFRKILDEMKEAGKGYRLTVHLYKFEQYGVPQKRHRIIIVGIRNDLNLTFCVPAPTTPKEKDYKTAEQALMVPPIKDSMGHNEATKQSEQVIQRLKHIPAGENAWYQGIPLEYRLKVKGATLSQIYKRLHPHKPSYTITGSGGGGTHGYHWKEPRALTNRERARIQTFPDSFRFCGAKESVRKQIGMAVPPDGAQHIFKALIKTFAGIKYKSVDANFIIEEVDRILDKVS